MAKNKNKSGARYDARFLIIYLLTWLTGLLMYLTEGQKDKRIKFHSFQAIVLGIVLIVIAIIFDIASPIIGSVLFILGWLYGMYIGYEASTGVDIDMPIISDFVRNYI
ncbi:MAG: hypothetical protein ACP5RP_02815 [Candidatus Micrarchaeia archaeon]